MLLAFGRLYTLSHVVNGKQGDPLISAEYPAAEFKSVLDCGGEAGMVLAALRNGVLRVRFDGPDAVAARLADIAGQRGAVIERGALEPALDLLGRDDAEAACRAFLAAEREAPPRRFP